MTPTDSCPNVRPGSTGSAPFTVCTSEVQISAAVVRTTASSGPGTGIGFSTTAVSPTLLITNARIVAAICVVLSAGMAGGDAGPAPTVPPKSQLGLNCSTPPRTGPVAG